MFCEDIHSALDSLVSRYDEAVVVRDESLQPSVVSRQLSEGSCLWLKGGEAVLEQKETLSEAEKLHKPHTGVQLFNHNHARPKTVRLRNRAFPLLFHEFHL